jgi:glycosyltransferase involved in cell wall biosynthesis
MKILSITAGAAGMLCGSCLRDNSLARELLARGHDVLLMPLYTPTNTDEPNVSGNRVFFGGVSVYLQEYVPFFRRTPWLLDRLWDSKWMLKAVSRRSIKTDPRMLGRMTVSMLQGADGHQRKELDKLLHWLRSEPAPDVVVLPNSLLIGLARPIREALRRPVCCVLQGEDLFLDGLQEPYRARALELIASQVGHVDAFLAVSEFYVDVMSRYLKIPPPKMRLVPLGINLDGYGPAPRRREGPFTVGYFARIAPEKGLHALCEAYRLLRQQDGLAAARLEVAGYLGMEHRPYLEAIERRMREWGLAAELRYHGTVDRAGKIRFLHGLDVLSVPATYDEPKGIFLFEAMANGVPVVQPRRGAFTEIVEKTGGGLLVPPDDPAALARALRSLADDPGRRRELAARGLAGVREHYDVARMADRALEVYEEVVAAAALPVLGSDPRG